MKKLFKKIGDKLKRMPRPLLAGLSAAVGVLLTLGICLPVFFHFEKGSVPANKAESEIAADGLQNEENPTESELEETQASSSEMTSSQDTWNETTAYTGGAQVVYQGGLYKAKWWTQNEKPAHDSAVWEYLGEVAPAQESSQAPAASSQTTASATGTKGFKVVAYYPSWKENGLNRLDFSVITHVNYAFAIPTSDGGLRPLENEALAKKVIEKAHGAGKKALLAVGGWSYQDTPLEPTFKAATDSNAKITKFGDAILAMCNQYGFDGIDMDWEHPRKDDSSMKQYESLMLYLSGKLKAKGKLLTSAVLSGATPDGTIYYDAAAHTDKVLGCVDWINVMAYDGGDGARHSSYEFAVNCGKYWKETRKLSAGKVVLGVPFYARPSWAAYSDILAADSNAWKKDVASYNGMEAHYNGTATIQKKTVYAKQNLGGVMIWEITQDCADQSKSLLHAIKEGAK